MHAQRHAEHVRKKTTNPPKAQPGRLNGKLSQSVFYACAG